MIYSTVCGQSPMGGKQYKTLRKVAGAGKKAWTRVSGGCPSNLLTQQRLCVIPGTARWSNTSLFTVIRFFDWPHSLRGRPGSVLETGISSRVYFGLKLGYLMWACFHPIRSTTLPILWLKVKVHIPRNCYSCYLRIRGGEWLSDPKSCKAPSDA